LQWRAETVLFATTMSEGTALPIIQLRAAPLVAPPPFGETGKSAPQIAQ
jgi:hypothetical protein